MPKTVKVWIFLASMTFNTLQLDQNWYYIKQLLCINYPVLKQISEYFFLICIYLSFFFLSKSKFRLNFYHAK